MAKPDTKAPAQKPPQAKAQPKRVDKGAPKADKTVARKMVKTMSALGLARFDLKYSAGTLAHENIMRCIELYGTKVIPMARELLAAEAPAPVAAK